jgi:hypothetical protein
MDIKIYEDQTGQMFYPEKRTDKDRDIVRLFGNKIDIFIKKTNASIEISCYALIQENLKRAIGCYITYKGTKYNQMFSEFKNEANKALTSLGFKISNDDTENAIFNNIEKFDTSSRLYNTNIIINALNSGECLCYGGGNLSEIGGFCKDILTLIPNIKIAISPKESRLGEINILRNTSYEERLNPFDETKQILDRQQGRIAQKIIDDRRKIEDARKNKEKEVSAHQLDEGVNSIEKAVNTLRTAGFTKNELIPIFNIYTTRINRVFEYEDERRPSPLRIEPENIDLVTIKEREKELEKEIDTYEEDENKGIRKTHIVLLSISLVILALSAGTFGVPYLLSVYHNIHPGPAPEPTPIQPISTSASIPASAQVSNQSSNSTIPENNSGSNITNPSNIIASDTINDTNGTKPNNPNNSALIPVVTTPKPTPKLTTSTPAPPSNTSSGANDEY